MDENKVLLKQVFPNRSRGWKYRIVVPVSLRNDIIYNYHDRIYSGHLSVTKVWWKIKLLFTWEGMYKDIENYIKTCDKCQRRNISHTKAPFQPVPPPSFPMQKLSIDLLGPFSRTKRNNKYLILYSENHTRMVFGSPLPNMEAQTVANDYLNTVFALHGASHQILTDRGPQFTGSIFENLCKKLGTKHILTSPYHANSNGISERNNQRILNALSHICDENYENWDDVIPFALFTLNSFPNRSTQESPFYLFHGFDPIEPTIEASATYSNNYSDISDHIEQVTHRMELARSEITDRLMMSSQINCRAKNDGRKLNEFNIGQKVLYLDMTSYTGKNRKLKYRFKGPYRVIERTGLVNYRIKNISNPNEIKSTHVDKLKHYFPREIIDDQSPIVDSKKNDATALSDVSSSDSEDEEIIFIPITNQTSEFLNKPSDNIDYNINDDPDNNSNVITQLSNDEQIHHTEPQYLTIGNDEISRDIISQPSCSAPAPLTKNVKIPIESDYYLRTNIKKPIRFR